MGHIHAELMAQYAEDAKQYDRPWEMWQHGDHEDWVGCTTHPSWHKGHSYRRKPRSTVVGEHVNAEILRAIADGKKVQYRKFHPLGWEPLQNADTVQCWKLLKGGSTVEWRVVPETVMVGEHEVPEPQASAMGPSMVFVSWQYSQIRSSHVGSVRISSHSFGAFIPCAAGWVAAWSKTAITFAAGEFSSSAVSVAKHLA